MVEVIEATRSKFDLSFQYSNECNLSCSFCMYSCGPNVKDRLDLNKLKAFIKTIDFDKYINSIGLYGGEVSLHLEEYSEIVKMLPTETKVWTITNGTWSKALESTNKFLTWASNNEVYPAIVSGNSEQVVHQNREELINLQQEFPNWLVLKGPDKVFLAMGRLENKELQPQYLISGCSEKCFWREGQATRIAVMPSGDIMFQTCDGSYPIVGNISEEFPVIAERLQDFNGFDCACCLKAYEDKFSIDN